MNVVEGFINWEIGWLKEEIEKSAPAAPEKKEERERFYWKLGKLPKEDQRDVLTEIYGAQEALGLFPRTKEIEEAQNLIAAKDLEEAQKREKARKRNEYIRRSLARGKIPKVKSCDPFLLRALHPPYRKKDILILCLWDLDMVLKKVALFPRYKTLEIIMRCFLGKHFGARPQEGADVIKRELARIRKDQSYKSFISDYEDFKVRSSGG